MELQWYKTGITQRRMMAFMSIFKFLWHSEVIRLGYISGRVCMELALKYSHRDRLGHQPSQRARQSQHAIHVVLVSPSATCWPGCQWHRTPDWHSAPQPRTSELKRSASLSLPSGWNYRHAPPCPT
uniref:Uncharacterized protein n=1 Tax=Chelydra serpentina TaxID=8475 RepID=A0A8C3S155_CHESE